MADIANNVRDLSVEQMRELFTCPISQDLFQDPVAERGNTCGTHVFEREYIEAWLQQRETCPLSRNPLTAAQLVSYEPLKRACIALDPGREDPITQEELDQARGVAAVFAARVRVHSPVPDEVRRSVLDRVAAKTGKCVEASLLQTSRCYKDFY